MSVNARPVPNSIFEGGIYRYIGYIPVYIIPLPVDFDIPWPGYFDLSPENQMFLVTFTPARFILTWVKISEYSSPDTIYGYIYIPVTIPV
jgi:hypothetical protein